MALTSRTHGVTGRIRTATSNLHEDNQSLISDIGKAFSLMKEIAVDFERAKQFERVKELENAVVELVDTYEDCSHFSSAIESVGVIYQPGPELTDFDKLFKNEVAPLKANSSSVPQNHPLMRQFREGVWDQSFVLTVVKVTTDIWVSNPSFAACFVSPSFCAS
ncbi:hypothetical protein ACFX2C_007736 [Malus domestica]